MEKLQGKWLIAVSGGPDSMALLHMCLTKGIHCGAAHINYHHRPEADEEESYVRSFCQAHRIPVYIYSKPFIYQGNFEAAARKLRYHFFITVAKQENYDGVLIGHHEDDFLETYIMQEEKNIIPDHYGLRDEIMMQDVLFKRPLLHMTKAALTAYCENNQLRYYIDATNLSDEYTRNRIRHACVEPMTRFERDALIREIERKNAVMHERRCRVKTYIRDDRIQLSTYRTLNEEDRLTLLRMFVEKQPHHSLKHLRSVDSTVMRTKDFMIPFADFDLVTDGRDILRCVPEEAYQYVYESILQLRDAKEKYFFVTGGEPGVNAVTLADTDFPIIIRSFQDGDRIKMRFGHKEVHRFFIDRHIPQYKRKMWPIVLNRYGEIILVPGLGCNLTHYSTTPNLNVVQY